MKHVSSKYIDAVRRECILSDLVTAYEAQPKEFIAEVTDHPQAVLDKYSLAYGVKLQAEEVLPVATYLVIKKQQGYDLKQLLAELPGSSASILAKLNHQPRQHASLFKAVSKAPEAEEATVRISVKI